MSDHIDEHDVSEYDSNDQIQEYRLSDRLYPSSSTADEFDGDLDEFEEEFNDDDMLDNIDEYDSFQLGDEYDELN